MTQSGSLQRSVMVRFSKTESRTLAVRPCGDELCFASHTQDDPRPGFASALACTRGLDNPKPLIVDRKRKVENDIGSAARMLYDVNSGTSSTQIDRMMAAMIATGDQVTNRSFLYVCLRH